MRSNYEILIDFFSEETINDMLIELHANAIHNTPVTKQGPLQLFREKLIKEGLPEYRVTHLAESALRDYVLIKHVEAYKRMRSYTPPPPIINMTIADHISKKMRE